MTLSGARKHCSDCQKPMQHWGTYFSGTLRWRCKECGKNSVRNRNDQREKKRWSLFVRWLTSKWSLKDFAAQEHIQVRTLSRWFESFWKIIPQPKPIQYIPRILMVDGTELKRRGLTLLIAANGETGEPIFWMPVTHETAETWERFFDVLHAHGAPEIIVCDGQKGLLKAAGTVFPSARIQRCMTHVIRYAKNRLTQHPKMKAGRELLTLVNQLSSIQTLRQKRRWILAFQSWKRRYHTFLKEKTTSPSGRWWYTHKMLRGVRTLLENATPDLFRFIRDSRVPKTSNRVEGGLNARCKELIRCHRGTSLRGKLILCCLYLSKRQG